MNKTTMAEVIEDFKLLFEKAESNKIAITGLCHDCKEAVTINADWNLDTGEVIIEGGAFYKIDTGNQTMTFFKCSTCYDKDPILKNFMPTEVYSRVTGYIRPVSQWNKGKQEEFELRKDFTI